MFDFVAKNGNNVEATLDFIERNVRLVAFHNVGLTLLLVCKAVTILLVSGVETPKASRGWKMGRGIPLPTD